MSTISLLRRISVALSIRSSALSGRMIFWRLERARSKSLYSNIIGVKISDELLSKRSAIAFLLTDASKRPFAKVIFLLLSGVSIASTLSSAIAV